MQLRPRPNTLISTALSRSRGRRARIHQRESDRVDDERQQAGALILSFCARIPATVRSEGSAILARN